MALGRNSRISPTQMRSVVPLMLLLAVTSAAQQPQQMTPETRGRTVTRTPRAQVQPPAPAQQTPAHQPPHSDERNRDATVQVQPRVVPPQERERWLLGVQTDTLDTGERIRRVTPRSPAERAGLEAGDTILTVAGYQVGRVDGRTYSLDDELRRRVANDGRVRLLVQNTRDSRLLNVDVQLDRSGTVGGGGNWGGGNGGSDSAARDDVLSVEATFRDRRAWPNNAEIRARIVEVGVLTRELVAEQSYRNLQGSPIRFEMWYPAREFKPGAELELRVEVWDGSKRWMVADPRVRFRVSQTTQPIRVELRPA